MKIFYKNILLYLLTAALTKCEDVYIVCFANCIVYTDDVLVLTIPREQWPVPKKLKINGNKQVSIKVTKENNIGGLMIQSYPDGFYNTDTFRWKCTPGRGISPTWIRSNFNDYKWPYAEFLGFNGDCIYNKKFFAGCIQMSEYATWIWHPSPNVSDFNCRFDDHAGKGLNLGYVPDRKAAKAYIEESELVFKSALVGSVVLTGMIGTSVVILMLNRVVRDAIIQV